MLKLNSISNPFKKPEPLSESSIFGQVRAENDEGVFSGYIVVWDQIDSYRSKFAKGAFAKTIKNDFGKMKVFFDHEHLIGTPVEMREDNTGVFVQGKINLNTSVGQDTWQFLKSGEINGLSFRFRTTKPDKFENGIRVIQEVQVREFGPVVFPAGDESSVTDLRAATFTEVLDAAQLRQERYQLLDSLTETLTGIHWDRSSEVSQQVDAAIGEFRTAYLDWCSRFYLMPESARSEILSVNDLATSVVTDMEGRSKSEYALDKGLSISDVDLLTAGNLIPDRSKLNNLAPEIRSNHQKIRAARIEELCWELRAGSLTPFETSRLKSLITTAAPVNDEIISALQNIQTTCK